MAIDKVGEYSAERALCLNSVSSVFYYISGLVDKIHKVGCY